MGKKLNGYYYCLSYSDEHHEVCSIANATREEAIQAAKREGARLYLVRYRNDQQQGKKKRIEWSWNQNGTEIQGLDL